MSITVKHDLQVLRMQVGGHVPSFALLAWADHAWLGGRVADAASAWADLLQREACDAEGHLDLLDALPAWDRVWVERVSVELPALTGVRPAIALPVDVVMAERAGLGFATAPTTGFSATRGDARAARDAVLDQARSSLLAKGAATDASALRPLANVEVLGVDAISDVWEVRTSAELGVARRKDSPLRHLVTWGAPVAVFAMASVRETLARALASDGGVILVGPGGVGKTALVRAARFDQPVWAADAVSLLLALMAGDRGWEADLPDLVADLHSSGAWLHIARLADLFEVGRYHTNPVSLGEALLPSVRAGRIRLITEATADELAAIDARFPGALAGMARVPVPVPTAKLAELLRDVAAARMGAAQVDEAAIDEVLRLLRRFHPYAGLPGRAVHLLTGLVADAVRAGEPRVTRDAVLARFARESGMPRALLDAGVSWPWASIHQQLADRVFDQPDALRAIADAIAMVKADVARWGRPLVSCLLVGPTGVGKTETAKAVAELLFGSPDRMIRLDMSEFSTPASVIRLISGGDGEGLLTGAVRRQPFSVLLLDEIEKAHPSALDLLLQVLGEARLVDDRGRVADFSGAVVLMTSNVGAVEARRPAQGFGRADDPSDAWQKAVADWLRPELRNRIDRTVIYQPLGPEGVRRVLDRELDALRRRPAMAEHALTVRPAALEELARLGLDPAWGARHLQRTLQERVVTPLARLINQHGGGTRLAVEVTEGLRLVVTPIPLRGGRAESGTPIPAAAPPSDAVWAGLALLDRRVQAMAEGDHHLLLQAELSRLRRRSELRDPAKAARADAIDRALARVDALARLSASLTRQAGTRALMGQARPAGEDALTSLRAQLREEVPAWLTAVEPEVGQATVGVYAPVASAREALVELMEALFVLMRARVTRHRLFAGAEPRLVEVSEGARADASLGDLVGVEFEVRADAAALLLAGLDGVATVERGAPAGKAPLGRVWVAKGVGGPGARERRRPRDVLRRSSYQDGHSERLTAAVNAVADPGRTVEQVASAYLDARVFELMEAP